MFQSFGHVSFHDPLCQPLDDRSLTDARLTDEHRIILRPARQNLNHSADFFIPSDHRVQLALAGQSRQVATVFFQRLVGSLGILAGDTLASSDLLESRQQPIPRQSQTLKDRTLLGHGEEDMLHTHVLIA